jgi:hypothetical protein
MYYRITESRFGDYVSIYKKGNADPVAYITLNKGDDENNIKVRRDLMDIDSEKRFNGEWNDHIPLIEKFINQLKDAGFTVSCKPERSIHGAKIYANELVISINFACFDKSLFSRSSVIYVGGKAIWTSIDADADRIIDLLSGGDYIHNLLADQERSSEELASWFKTLDLSDDD